MNRSRILVVFTIALLTFASVGAFAATAKSHGMTVRGTIASLDQSAKTLRVDPKKGNNVDLVWNDATKVDHPPLAVGQQVTVRYMVKDGKNVATVINAPAPKAAKATKTTKATKASAKKS